MEHYPRVLEPDIPVDELGNADYSTLNLVQDIQKGEVICEIVPPTRGTPGNTVTGRPIPAECGKPAEVPQGRNTVLSEDGRNLVATRAGHVEFSGRVFQVKPVLEIPDQITTAMGDLNFLGDIHIHGDVCSGVSIRALGSIQVDGVIEGCTVEAGEHIIVSSGVQGQERAVLRAHKSVFAKYLEHCCVYARESVQADCIINCDIYSNGSVRARTGRGIILGGTIRAATQVSAKIIGSKAERLTMVALGGPPVKSLSGVKFFKRFKRLRRNCAN